jgi:hypothetical protein
MGVEVELAQRAAVEQEAEDLSRALSEPVSVNDGRTASSTDKRTGADLEHRQEASAPTSAPQSESTAAPGTQRTSLSAAQQQAVAELVQQAAEWGAVRNQAGLSVQGAKLRWEAGVPRLVTPSTTSARAGRSHTSAGSIFRESPRTLSDEFEVQERVKRLESRVAELDGERRRLGHFLAADPSSQRAAEDAYRDAVERLRALDPRSAYVD